MIRLANKIDLCSCTIIHQDVVERATAEMQDHEISIKLSELFKLFADPTRIKLLNALYISEMCVCDIAACLNMTHSAISHQLRLLKMYNLVKSRKEGKVVYYSLADSHVTDILSKGLEHINE
ncbi:ArsR/SmtB family transcription factor [Cellulosilyticum sp. I15G10I2]|uniref:ArsR/SmtB family transcription factor n=1 Tax=Cellulosilyticum sp. I15G10I2 TaxID=1892843 RepID=UPI00085BFC4D|nr:metalloregulator ArsR/SmtB family transcription factor [Cellulosilyticum sp. I15G10I2]